MMTQRQKNRRDIICMIVSLGCTFPVVQATAHGRFGLAFIACLATYVAAFFFLVICWTLFWHSWQWRQR